MYQSLFARQGLSIDRLRTLLQVVDAGNIALAAPGDSIRQSQYSRQISELEEFFGQDLFARRGRSRVLTPAGERLTQVVRDTFKGLSDLRSAASGERACFALGAGDSLLHGLVVPRLGRALARLRSVQIAITSLAGKDVLHQLEDGRLDFGIVRTPSIPRGLGSAPLGTIEYAVYAPTRLRAKWSSPEDLLANAPFALQQSEPELNQKLVDHARKRGIALDLQLACETFPQALQAVKSGHYASLLPTLARDELRSADVEEVKLTGLVRNTAKIGLCWQKRTLRVRADGESVARALGETLRIT